MDSLPFIVPIAGFVLLVNGLWTCCQGRRIRVLEARVGMLEDTQLSASQTRPVAIPVHATPTAVYYPPYQAPMPQASAPPANFIRI